MSELSLRFTARDLTAADLPACGWAGTGVPDGLERSQRGEVDYLVVCSPSGLPVATGGVDYLETPGAGTLYQLHVHEVLRCCGIGTILIHEAELRIRARGVGRAELGIDENDPRPQRLYERLGYTTYGRKPGGWDQEQTDGSISYYETMIILMQKSLGQPTSSAAIRA